MSINFLPAGRKTLCKDDVSSGSFSQVRQFTDAVLMHLNPRDKILGTLFAKDLYHMGSNESMKKIRSIFREHSNQLLSRVYMSEVVISEPHLLFTEEQVEYIRNAYSMFLNTPRLIEEAKERDFERSFFRSAQDITGLELYILDFAHEIGKYGRYKFGEIRKVASTRFENLSADEIDKYNERAKALQTRIGKTGAVFRNHPELLPERTKRCLKTLCAEYCSFMSRLDLLDRYLNDHEQIYEY